MSLKEKVLNQCIEKVETRIQSLESALQSVKESRDNESKSSVGDKYETGRAMMHMEEEKFNGQLQQAFHSLAVLKNIDSTKAHSTVVLGSLVQASNGMFFISVALGKVTIDQQMVYAISLESPIGKAFFNLKEGGEMVFQGKEIVVQKIY